MDSRNSPNDPHERLVETDEAFVALLTSHQGAIHSYIHSLLPGDPGVEDILQRANIVLWKKKGKFEAGTNFKAWAFSIARWELRAWLTERKRQDWLVFDDELTNQIATGFQQMSDADEGTLIQSLRICLAKLNDKQRFLILNFYQHGKSIAECATMVKRSEGSLRVTLFRIRTALRKCIESRITREGAGA